ncbi:uncharacterized protein LOC141612523 [Silene latifolia]|uniref:uncharacterized protein LOC141612523 n=1 Tax=Silene latifolia TaxID=37657 RepID=UPI003D76D632
MALAKDHHQTSSRSFYENMLEVGSSVQFPHISPYGFDHYDQQQDGDGFESPNSNNNTNDNKAMNNNNNNNNNNNSQVISNSPSLSSSSSANSSNNGFTIHNHASNYQPHEEANSLISFKSGYGNFIHSNNNSGSLLSFQHEDHHNQVAPETYQKLSNPIDHHPYPIWEGSSSTSMNNHHHHQQSQNLHLLEEVGRLRTSSGDYQDAANDWLYASEADAGGDPPQEAAPQRTCFNKRPNMEEETNMQVPKKQCTSKKPAKPKSSSITKDPQSVAAKNRRERISERLKILQDLVPNGSKVDLVTMLEKAIGYVKFLQLQVKVLATDEFWPAAGGKAPDISQVREAIDAILLSQRSEGTTTSRTTTTTTTT